MGDEQAAPSQDTARSSWLAPTTEELNVPDMGFLLKTPHGILAAQGLVGNRALQRLLRPAQPDPIEVSCDADTATAPSPNGAQATAGNRGDSAGALNGGPGNVTYSYSKNSTSGGNFQFTDPTTTA